MTSTAQAYVLGVALAPASPRCADLRLEELAYRTARDALDAAGVSRGQIDHLTIGASDELDARPISSMLLAAPSGGFLVDEIRVTDSGLTALAAAVSRILSGEFHLGLVASWCKSSKTDLEDVMTMRCEPFFTRALGIGGLVGDALIAQATALRFGVSEHEAACEVVESLRCAADNPRGMRSPVPSVAEVLATGYDATPLRRGHRAPTTDGAVALVIASGAWLRAHPGHEALARIAGVGWCSDSYRLDARRLGGFEAAARAWSQAMGRAGWSGADALDVAEIESPTGYHRIAHRRTFGLDGAQVAVSPSGGCFAQHPYFCTGLVHAAEAALQVSGRAGAVQRPGARRAAAHGCHGTAQQGHVVALLEGT